MMADTSGSSDSVSLDLDESLGRTGNVEQESAGVHRFSKNQTEPSPVRVHKIPFPGIQHSLS